MGEVRGCGCIDDVSAVTTNLEECDDGNQLSNDGCDLQCHVEKGWVCVPSKTPGEERRSNCTNIAGEVYAERASSSFYLNVIRVAIPAVVGFLLLICAVVIYLRCPGITMYGPLRKLVQRSLDSTDEMKMKSARLTGADRLSSRAAKFSELHGRRGKEQRKTAEQDGKRDEACPNTSSISSVAPELLQAIKKQAKAKKWNLYINTYRVQLRWLLLLSHNLSKARNLPATDIFLRDRNLIGLADPFVVCELSRFRVSKKRVTDVSSKSDVCFSIIITVWDFDMFKTNDFMGQIIVSGEEMIAKYYDGPPEGVDASGGYGSAYMEEGWYEKRKRSRRMEMAMEEYSSFT
eukprot:765656-Hanusia_phi.AAC.1